QVWIERVAAAEVRGAVVKAVDGRDAAVAVGKCVPRVEPDGAAEVGHGVIELQRLEPAKSTHADSFGIVRIAGNDGLEVPQGQRDVLKTAEDGLGDELGGLFGRVGVVGSQLVPA